VTRGKLRNRLRFGLTDAGMMLLRGVLYVGLAALVVPAFGVLTVLISVMATALLVGLLVRPRISLTGTMPDRLIAGQTAELAYTLRNVGRLAAYHLSLQLPGLPETFEPVGEARVIARLAPGETAEVALMIRPQKRGSYRISQPVCRSSFPFNLFHFGTSHRAEETLLVLPAFSLLPMLLPCASRHVSVGGARPAGRTGASPEYVGNRPFLAGDSPRRIDVRAWARLARPATKEYDNDLDSYAALILDTRVPQTRSKAKTKESRELEAAVSFAASVAYSIHRSCLIDLLLAGDDLHSFAGLPRPVRLERIHELLAGVAPRWAYPWERIGPLLGERLPEISEAIFILLRLDDVYRQLIEQAERAGCHCTVVVVGEPGREAQDRGPGIGDGREAVPPSCAFCLPPSACRFVAPEEILAGRIEPL
jgi:uncharacterized protein (DUF58 family)